MKKNLLVEMRILGVTKSDKHPLEKFAVGKNRVSILRGYQSFTDGIPGEFRHTVEVEFFHDLATVGRNGFLADE